MQVRPHIDPLTMPSLRVQFPSVTRQVELLHRSSGPLHGGGLSRCRGNIGELNLGRRSCGA